MFAPAASNSAPRHDGAHESDGDDDWLRVGRSFKGSSSSVVAAASVEERALQVYAKPKKRPRRASSSDSASDRETRRSRSHRKDHKKKKKKKKSEKKTKKNTEDRRRDRSDAASSSGSSDGTGDGGTRRRHAKTERRDDHERRNGWRGGYEDGAPYRRSRAIDEHAFLEAPSHGELEVYDHSNGRHKEKLFEFDCAGDRENLLFGTLYTNEQPLYHLSTRRSVVDGKWIVDRPTNKTHLASQQAVDKTAAPAHANRYFGRAARMTERGLGTRRLHLAYSQRRLARRERLSAQVNTEEMSFIPLDAVVEGELAGLTTNAATVDSDDASDSARQLWRTDLENVERYIVARQKELNERVAANASDIDAWLDVIAFQDQMRRLSGKSPGDGSSNESGAVLEKQKAVLAKAIESNPDSRSLRHVQLNLLWREQQTTAAHSDSDAYRLLVENLLEKDRTSALLWRKLIAVAQQKFGSFSMTMLRDTYARVTSVLYKELMESSKVNDAATPLPSQVGGGFVHVVGSNSLLSEVDRQHADSLSDKARDLSNSLMMFHKSMIRAELSAGFMERAVALAQALIEFNLTSTNTPAPTCGAQHSEQVETFTKRWNNEVFHFGDDSRVESWVQTAQLPEVEAVDAYCSEYINQLIWRLRLPDVIRSSEHMKDLLGAFDEDHKIDHDEPERTGDDVSREHGGHWIYSNLHGQRIWIADTDESHEYERILNDLRGSDQSRDRHQAQHQKMYSKRELRLELLTRLRDERPDYPPIDPEQDKFLDWIVKESRADILQWKPLQQSNTEHSQLIEMQPDRAVLTEEIVPFVFFVPRHLHLHTVMNLLDVLGLRLSVMCGDVDDYSHLLSADDFSQFALFTMPILEALDPSTASSIGMSKREGYDLVRKSITQLVQVAEIAAADPKRVQFIRNVFIGAMRHFSSSDGDAVRLMKALWMEYEVDVLLRGGKQEKHTTSFRSFCQSLLSTSDTRGGVDAWLMSVYAVIELRLNNKRQVNRICDKTISTIVLNTPESSHSSRSFHRLVFLRVNQELDTSTDSLAVMKGFYLLWQTLAPRSSCTLEVLMKQCRKNPVELESRLRAHVEQYHSETTEKYRAELRTALHQCARKDKHDTLCWATCNVPFALSNLCTAIYTSRGFHAAAHEFRTFLGEATTTKDFCHDRQCWLMFLSFVQAHRVCERTPLIPPRDWRNSIADAVKAFPLEPVFLRLFIDAETSNTMSQSLRKHFQTRRHVWQRSLDSPELVEWLFALLCEFARAERCGSKFGDDRADRTCCVLHRWGKNRPAVERIRHTFEEMVGQQKTSGAAIAWRLYLRFELAVGKAEAARKVFYRGLAECPWSKALFLDGYTVLRPYLSQSECEEISDFLSAKELHVRVDIQE